MRTLLAILLLPVLAQAVPGNVTRYLVSEPASLLDLSMLRLQVFASEFENRVGLHWTDNGEYRFFKATVHASFDADDDRFYVYISARSDEPNDEQMAEGCEHAMGQMNIWLLKSMPGLFLHTAYDGDSLPPDFFKELSAMFEIRCSFAAWGDSSKGRFWATRPLGLLGDRQINIGKWKMSNE
jgi:hypothetical protein